jgi:hypothetical protein
MDAMTFGATASLLTAFAITLAIVPLGPAKADCAGVLEQLKPLVERIVDPTVKQLVMIDLQRARIDVLEADEEECAMWVIHAARMMGMR